MKQPSTTDAWQIAANGTTIVTSGKKLKGPSMWASSLARQVDAAIEDHSCTK